MFLLIPTVLFLASAAGIAVIVWRKLPYLKKLVPASHSTGEPWLHDMFPELVGGYRAIPFRQHKETWLKETEKLLRKMRLLFSKIDRVSDTLIHKVRRVHLESAIRDDASAGQDMIALPGADNQTAVIPVKPKHQAKPDADQLKRREQELIVAIAKDPRNDKLFAELGDLYMEMKSFSDAKETFEAALELAQENEELKKKLALVSEKLLAAASR